MSNVLSAGNAACSIYGLEVTVENKIWASKKLEDAGLEPVTTSTLIIIFSAKAGISVDDIVVHGNWSSKRMFEHFYRLSSSTSTNFMLRTMLTYFSLPQYAHPFKTPIPADHPHPNFDIFNLQRIWYF
ncbi:uncharacterized protein BX664DRAFT_313786 [Halteromyces radiatus]|uniref:uncharacterized protein n=1 Tax=Halteromyces radiatus TaxID=101107 RepID=UPI00221F1D68|nr:uncharacterized protein BX664DRAFT_313786 [Halteromyces radiatus]KAI8093772.1 hypothetical protein BX664DRAFT_313786 [Halteromyces radiatus]